MKRSLFRIAAMLLTLVMLITALYVSPLTASAAETTASDAPVLAYVPLDDRPVVTDRVQYAATAAGFDIQFPPDKSWYQTHLDNQLVNEDDTRTKNTDESQVGSGLRIMDWLDEMEESGCDYYIIHLDMMFSGGLVGSRFPDTHYDADGYLDISEQLAIAERLAALAQNSENHVYFVDTVMRLASTGGFKGYNLKEYNSIREYSKKARYPLVDIWWGFNDYDEACRTINGYVDPVNGYQNGIKDFYSLDANWGTITYRDSTTADADHAALTQEQIDLYHLARQRKLRLITYMMYHAQSAYYVIGVDDASPENTIQTNEIKFIRKQMSTLGVGYSLFADTDSAALMALARCSVEYHCEEAPKVYVEYFGDRKNDPADQYDIGTLSENVDSHIICMGAESTTNRLEADIEMLILTRIGPSVPSDPETADDYSQYGATHKGTYAANVTALVNRANANIAEDIPTIVMDCSSCYIQAFNDGTNNLQDALLNDCTDIGRLLGYSNWNTAGNTLGIGCGQGMSRYAYLQSDCTKTARANIAAAQSIIYSYVKDIVYVARHKGDGKQWMFKYKLFRDEKVDKGTVWVKNENRYLAIWNDVNGNMYQTMLDYTNLSTAQNSWEFCTTERYLNNWLTWEMGQAHGSTSTHTDSFLEVCDILEEDTIYTDLADGARATQGIGNIEISNFRMPWYRIFEITFNIDVDLEDTYTYNDGYIMVDCGTVAESFVEDVKADKTATGSSEMFGGTDPVTYKGYGADTATPTATYSLTSPGPTIYTDDSIASVTLKNSVSTVEGTSVVGTGYEVTVNSEIYTTVVQGDVASTVSGEGDGVIDTRDARDALRYVVGATELNAAQIKAADMDGNSTLGSNDARRILQKALSL